MLTPDIASGADYGEAWPNGPWIHSLNLPPQAPEHLLYTRVSEDGRVVAVGNGSDLAQYWNGSKWMPLCKATGNSPCAFGPDGTVYVSTDKGIRVFDRAGVEIPSKFRPGYAGSQGLRYVLPDGTPITGDNTKRRGEHLYDWTDLGDGIFVGQGADETGGGVLVEIDGEVRRLSSGTHRFIRANRVGDVVAITFVDQMFPGNVRYIVTLDQLRSLPLYVVPEPEPKPTEPPVEESVNPKITVKDYARVIKEGEACQLFDMQIGDTHVVITKDANDNLVVSAENPAGSDHTSAVRTVDIVAKTTPQPDQSEELKAIQKTIAEILEADKGLLELEQHKIEELEAISDMLSTPEPQPEPEPEPEPEPQPEPGPVRGDDRIWFGPNIASQDEVRLFAEPDLWKTAREHVDVFSLYVQNVMSGGPIAGNTYEALVQQDAFKKLKAWGIPLSIECGSVKPGDCKAEGRLHEITEAIKRVREAGGEVAFVSMDEPLTGSKQSVGTPACNNTIEQNADYVANFIRTVEQLGPSVGWIEAWPEIPFETQRSFLALLQDRGALPAFWHLDIDWHRAEKEGKSPENTIAEAKKIADSYGIALGVMLAGYPHDTDADYAADVVTMANRVKSAAPNIHHLCVQSWAARQDGLQVQPINLPETLSSSHTAIVKAVAGVFAGTLPGPAPKPRPHRMPPVTGPTMSFKTSTGHFLSVGPDGRVIASITTEDDSAQFEVVSLGNGLIALRSKANGRFLTAEEGGGRELVASRDYTSVDQLGGWEQFKVVMAGGSIGLQSDAGLFVSPQQGGGGAVIVDGPAFGAWEPLKPSGLLFGIEPVVPLHIKDEMFMRPDGSVFPWRGVTAFLLFKRWLDGDKDGVREYMQWAAATGFNVLRVFSQVDWAANSSNGSGFLAASYKDYDTQLDTFMTEANSYGLYVEMVAHTFDYDLDQMAVHVARLDNGLSVHKNAFLEVSNEPQVTKINISGLLGRYRPSKTIWASGAYYPTAEPGGMYVTAHTKRDSEWPRKAKDVHEYRIGKGPYNPTDPAMRRPIVADEPIGAGEPGVNYDHQRATNPTDFYAYAALSQMMGAGGTYHYDDGLRAKIPTGNQLVCAQAFAQGLRAVPAIAQSWSYTRSGGTGSPVTEDKSLRTYVKMSGGHAYAIRVRAEGNYGIASGWREVSRDQYGIVIELTR